MQVRGRLWHQKYTAYKNLAYDQFVFVAMLCGLIFHILLKLYRHLIITNRKTGIGVRTKVFCWEPIAILYSVSKSTCYILTVVIQDSGRKALPIMGTKVKVKFLFFFFQKAWKDAVWMCVLRCNHVKTREIAATWRPSETLQKELTCQHLDLRCLGSRIMRKCILFNLHSW